MRLRILEGTDGVGKSEHARWLGQAPGSVVLHYGPPDGDPIEMYVARVVRWLAAGQRVILDRSSFGSRVWADLGFHPPTLPPGGMRIVSRWYAGLGGCADIVIRPAPHILATLEKRDEIHTAPEVLSAQALYLRMLANREVYYLPVAAVTSDLLHELRNTTTWN